MTTENSVSGEFFSTEQFSVLVPTGWMEIRATDPFENGKLLEDKVYICKGATSNWDIFHTTWVCVTYKSNDPAMIPPPKSFYENTADIKPFTVDKYNLMGFTGEIMHKPMIVIWSKNDKEYLQFDINTEVDGKKISLEDADVQAIINSFKPVEK